MTSGECGCKEIELGPESFGRLFICENTVVTKQAIERLGFLSCPADMVPPNSEWYCKAVPIKVPSLLEPESSVPDAAARYMGGSGGSTCLIASGTAGNTSMPATDCSAARVTIRQVG
jgi:hypothetical protein